MLFLPVWSVLLAFGLNCCCGRFVGYKGTLRVSLVFLSFAVIFSLIALVEVVVWDSVGLLDFGSWLDVNLLSERWALYFDFLAIAMQCTILLIALMVHLYSFEYLNFDPYLSRFLTYLSLFSSLMLLLIISNNLLVFFIGWEGIGLASYLLIGFWYTRQPASQSSVKALLVNRIGDLGMMGGLALLFNVFKSVDFVILSGLVPFGLYWSHLSVLTINLNVVDLAGYALFIGAMAKSSQISLHSWLYSAMEGPTPVSSLIHAATLVTAGVYLLLRCTFLVELSPSTLALVCIIGGLTTILAGTAGLVQHDLKAIIAFSTASQLGFIFLGCGVGLFHISFFHLVNHAYFKATLFLCAGSAIHSVQGEQDLRRLGGLASFLPVTFNAMFFSSLSLSGFFGLAGFYSKDFLIESALLSYIFTGFFAEQVLLSYVLLITTLFTSIYSFRLLFLLFFNNVQMYKVHFLFVEESGWKISSCLVFLCILSVVSGFVLQDLFVGLGVPAVRLFTAPANFFLFEVESFLHPFVKFSAIYLFFAGITLLAWNVKQNTYLFFSNSYRHLFFVLNKKWLWDKLQTQLSYFVLYSGLWFIYFILDKGLFEQIGKTFGQALFSRVGWKLFLLQYGQVSFYLYFLIFVSFITFNFLILTFKLSMLGFFCPISCLLLVRLLS